MENKEESKILEVMAELFLHVDRAIFELNNDNETEQEPSSSKDLGPHFPEILSLPGDNPQAPEEATPGG